LATAVAQQLDAGRFPLVLGGGHEMAWGTFTGLALHLAQTDGAPRVGIINFDAHFDLRRDARATSGTPFLQIAQDCSARGWDFRYACLGVSRYANTEALFARARELGVLSQLDESLDAAHFMPALQAYMAEVDDVYLTFCLDVLPAAVAPGVSAPAARGVGLDVLEPLIDAVCASGKLRVADIAEMNPRFDVDGRTAAVAARVAARIANGVARALR
jgi:formiminoglutamase